jgi:hypothetical protein
MRTTYIAFGLFVSLQSMACLRLVDESRGWPCSEHDDCPSDMRCSTGDLERHCVPRDSTECHIDSDCLGGSKCLSGACVDALACESTADCDGNAACIDKRCETKSCSQASATVCAPYSCDVASGTCHVGCLADEDCAAPNRCDDAGRCSDTYCDSSSERLCGNYACNFSSKTCYETCRSDADCSSLAHCSDTKQCVATAETTCQDRVSLIYSDGWTRFRSI